MTLLMNSHLSFRSVLAGGFLLVAATLAAGATAARPNVLFIAIDDLRTIRRTLLRRR